MMVPYCPKCKKIRIVQGDLEIVVASDGSEFLIGSLKPHECSGGEEVTTA